MSCKWTSFAYVLDPNGAPQLGWAIAFRGSECRRVSGDCVLRSAGLGLSKHVCGLQVSNRISVPLTYANSEKLKLCWV